MPVLPPIMAWAEKAMTSPQAQSLPILLKAKSPVASRLANFPLVTRKNWLYLLSFAMAGVKLAQAQQLEPMALV